MNIVSGIINFFSQSSGDTPYVILIAMFHKDSSLGKDLGHWLKPYYR